MDLIFMIAALVILFSCRFSKEHIPLKESMALSSTNRLRGMMSILIILHHMSERVNEGMLFPQLRHIGYMIVGFFLFLSGYGLMTQYLKRGKQYLHNFWKKRIGYICVVHLSFSFLYWGFRILLGERIAVIDFLASYVNGHPIASNSWYVLVQILLYILFWLVFSIPNTDTRMRIVMVMVGELCLWGLFSFAGFSSVWYISNLCFVLGIVCAYYESQIQKLLDEHWGTALTSAVVCFTVFSVVPLLSRNIDFGNELLNPIYRMISTQAIVCIVLCVLSRIRITGDIWVFLGDLSLEIYLIHGMVISILYRIPWVAEKSILWTVLTVVISVFLAWPIRRVNKRIKQLLN